MNIKYLTVTSLLAFSMVTPPVYAINVNTNVKTEAKAEVRGESTEKSESKPGFLKSLFTRSKAAVGSGEITAISGTTLTIEKDGTTFTVLTDSNTQFRRKFWGTGSLSDLEIGHTVTVIGHWTDETHTTIKAKHVRDLSIQMRHGVFFGVVQALTGSGWSMTTIKRGSQTVTVGADTKFINRKEEPITQSDVKVGHRVRVRGLWDNTLNSITDVKEVKDFSLPVKAATTPGTTPTATPTSTPTATPTPTPTLTPTPTP